MSYIKHSLLSIARSVKRTLTKYWRKALLLRPPIAMAELPDGMELTDLVPKSLSGPLPSDALYPGAKFTDYISVARTTTDSTNTTRAANAIAPAFDYSYYFSRSKGLLQYIHDMDLIQHYLRVGISELRDPSPHFSSTLYLERYPDVAASREDPFLHWLRIGLSEGRIGSQQPEFEKIAEALDLNPQSLQLNIMGVRNDLRERLETGKLGEMVAKAAKHEPLIEQVWPKMTSPQIQPFHVPEVALMNGVIANAQKQAKNRRAKAVICVNAPRWGAGRRLEGHLAFALTELLGAENVLIMVTDEGGDIPAWKRPEGVRYVDFTTQMGELEDDRRQRALLGFLRSLRSEMVFNVNSKLLWQTIGSFGPVMQEEVPVIGCFFCSERDGLGFHGGYPASQFYRTYKHVHGFVTDSHFLRGDLIRQYVVPEEEQNRIHVLEAPVDATIPVAADPNSDAAAKARLEVTSHQGKRKRVDGSAQHHFVKPYPSRGAEKPTRPQVFWAGRLDAQKRLDVLYEIAAAMPEIDFRVWGEPIAKRSWVPPNAPDNIWFEGSYSKFAELPLHDASAWLYTSAWDGVPSILLEVAMSCVPIVGTEVGGTGEVLVPDLTHPVKDVEDIQAYVSGINEVLKEPDIARNNALSLRKKLCEDRTEQAYVNAVRHIYEGISK